MTIQTQFGKHVKIDLRRSVGPPEQSGQENIDKTAARNRGKIKSGCNDKRVMRVRSIALVGQAQLLLRGSRW